MMNLKTYFQTVGKIHPLIAKVTIFTVLNIIELYNG